MTGGGDQNERGKGEIKQPLNSPIELREELNSSFRSSEIECRVSSPCYMSVVPKSLWLPEYLTYSPGTGF